MHIMNKSILIIFLSLLPISSEACIIDPLSRVAGEVGKYFEQSDVVFLGRLDGYEISESDHEQTAEFIIIRTFKGEKGNRVTVSNQGGSSCSRGFKDIGTAYYVFANIDEETGMLVIGPYATFVPMEVALEYNMRPLTELMHNKSNQAGTP